MNYYDEPKYGGMTKVFVKSIDMEQVPNHYSHVPYLECGEDKSIMINPSSIHNAHDTLTVKRHIAEFHSFGNIHRGIRYDIDVAFHHRVREQLGSVGVFLIDSNRSLSENNDALLTNIDRIGDELSSIKRMNFIQRLIFLFKGVNMDFSKVTK